MNRWHLAWLIGAVWGSAITAVVAVVIVLVTA